MPRYACFWTCSSWLPQLSKQALVVPCMAQIKICASGLVCGQSVVTSMMPQNAGHGRAWENQVLVSKAA